MNVIESTKKYQSARRDESDKKNKTFHHSDAEESFHHAYSMAGDETRVQV